MKKSGDSLDVGPVESERLGALLSTSLNKLHNEECVSPEEIAALVDGHIDDSDRDRIMGHLASCDRCYEVFLLTSELKEDNIIPMRRTFFSHPMRLAASVIVAVFSLFLVYKIAIAPGAADKIESKPPAVREAPTLMLKEGYEVEKRSKREEKMEPETEEEISRLKERRIEKSAGEEPAERPALKGGRDDRVSEKGKGVVGGIAKEGLHKKGPVPPTKKEWVPPQKKSSHAKKISSKRSIEEERKAGKAAAVEVRGKKGTEMKTQARQEELDRDAARQQKDVLKQRRAVPEKVALADKKSPGKEPAAGAVQKRDRAPATGVDTRAAAQRLNWELSKHGVYIPAEEIGSLFESAVRLSRRYRNETGDRFGRDEELEESAAQAVPAKDLAPAMMAGTGGDAGLVLPDTGYFYKKSAPGTPANKFFKLALSGYCDGSGCYGLLTSKLGKGKRDKLLKSWQELKPQLTGIFSEIAGHTINHLSK